MIFKSNLKGNFGSPFLIVPLFLVLFLSCNDISNNELDLLYGTSYTLVENEIEISKNQTNVQTFEALRDSLGITSSALYKIVAHPEYKTYIALDLNAKATIGPTNVFTTFDFKNQKGTWYKYQTKSNKIFQVFNLPSNSNESLDSKFTQQDIEKRFKNK